MEYWEHQEHDNLKIRMQRIFLVLKIENCNYNENVNSMWKITSDSKKQMIYVSIEFGVRIP